MPVPPAPGFGDSIGAMTIAGGILGALFHRERTGEATIVDVSLLGVGMWAMGQAIALSLVLGMPWAPPPADRMSSNPLSRNYETDGRPFPGLHLPAGRQVLAAHVRGHRPPGAGDRCPLRRPRVTAGEQHGGGRDPDRGLRLGHAGGQWRDRLASFSGQWAVVQDTLEAVADPQTVANGYMQECHTAAGTPFRLVAAPVQFDEEPAVPDRAPEFNEHGDSILAGIGLDEDAIIDLKVRGVVA